MKIHEIVSETELLEIGRFGRALAAGGIALGMTGSPDVAQPPQHVISQSQGVGQQIHNKQFEIEYLSALAAANNDATDVSRMALDTKVQNKLLRYRMSKLKPEEILAKQDAQLKQLRNH